MEQIKRPKLIKLDMEKWFSPQISVKFSGSLEKIFIIYIPKQ
jgi:hypothetical protein